MSFTIQQNTANKFLASCTVKLYEEVTCRLSATTEQKVWGYWIEIFKRSVPTTGMGSGNSTSWSASARPNT